MKYKLYRYDYEGGTSLGGADYGPGTEWYLTDDDGYIKFCKRVGVDDKFWKHTGCPRKIDPEKILSTLNFLFHKRKRRFDYEFVRYMDEKELVGQVKNMKTGDDIALNKVKNFEVNNAITGLDISDD